MIKTVALRIGRRRTVWEEDDVGTIVRAEFHDSRNGGVDLRPSVYQFDAEAEVELQRLAVQARTEHLVVHTQPLPPRGAKDVDLNGLGVRISPRATNSPFRFTREAHGELLLRDEAQLHAVIEAVRAEFGTRALEVSRERVLAYVSERLAANDPEWKSFFESVDGHRSKWLEQVHKFRRRP